MKETTAWLISLGFLTGLIDIRTERVLDQKQATVPQQSIAGSPMYEPLLVMGNLNWSKTVLPLQSQICAQISNLLAWNRCCEVPTRAIQHDLDRFNVYLQCSFNALLWHPSEDTVKPCYTKVPSGTKHCLYIWYLLLACTIFITCWHWQQTFSVFFVTAVLLIST